MVRARRAGLGLGVAAGVYVTLQVLGRAWGSTGDERRASLPGDEVVQAPDLVTDHARTLAATPDAVWPWLTQAGWHLGGWYTPRWVDRLLFPGNWPSLDRLDPLLVRDLQVGDVVPDGPPGTAWFEVAEIDPPRVLVLHSVTHVPRAWRDRWGAGIDWTWTFLLAPRPGGRTRLQIRVRGRLSPWWLRLAYHAAIIPADIIMAVGMLRGLDRRLRAGHAPQVSGREPFANPTQAPG